MCKSATASVITVEPEDFLNSRDNVIEENTELESWTIILLS